MTVLRGVLLVLWLGTVVALAAAQEIISLSTPESGPSLTGFRVERLIIQPDDPDLSGDDGRLWIHLVGIGRPTAVSCLYSPSTTPTATTLITGLNKANLSSTYAGTATTGSLTQRIHHRLVVMGEATQVCGRSLVGALAGSVP